MTDEELDTARAEEAFRLYCTREAWPELRAKYRDVCRVAAMAASLTRQGWMPPKPEPEIGSVWGAHHGWRVRVLGVVGEADNPKTPRTVVYVTLKDGLPGCVLFKCWHRKFTLTSKAADEGAA